MELLCLSEGGNKTPGSSGLFLLFVCIENIWKAQSSRNMYQLCPVFRFDRLVAT